jgi:protein-tyrosine phosphatase
MHHSFWLIPNLLAGRPGPNREPWHLASLQAQGVRAVLSVNDGECCHADDFKRWGIDYLCSPLSANAPPEPGDLEQCLAALPRAHEFIASHVLAGHLTLVHCNSGKDRTALQLAYYLMRKHGCAVEDAIARVKAVRPIAFTATGWDSFAYRVLAKSAT